MKGGAADEPAPVGGAPAADGAADGPEQTKQDLLRDLEQVKKQKNIILIASGVVLILSILFQIIF